MNWRFHVKRAIPPSLLNATLLRFPALYATPWVRYETNLIEDHGVEDLLDQLGRTLDVPGDIVECGSSRCGGSVLMARLLRHRGVTKVIHACDSFEGFDRAELSEERRRGLTGASDRAFTSTSLPYVQRKLRALGLEEAIVPVKGYFSETLPRLRGPWSFALVDCDLRNSIAYCAEQVWPRLSPGGRMVFDDYACADFAGARLGVGDFLARFGDEIAEHGLLRRLYFARKRDATP
jgi:hypothetical protein